MQDINNDMDDLFRKAAEQYPLGTNGSDWSKVLNALKEEDASATVVASTEKKRRKRALWLLCLLPLCALYFPLHNYNSVKRETIVVKKSAAQNKSITNNRSSLKSINGTAPPSPANENEVAINPDNTNVQSFDAGGNKKLNHTQASLLKHTNSSDYKKAVTVFNSSQTKTNNENDKGEEETTLPLNKNNTAQRQPDETSQRIQETTTSNRLTEAELKKEDTTMASLKSGKDTLVTKDSSLAKRETVAQKNKKKDAQTQRQPGFYGGLAGSFDASTIKLQRINKTGYGLQVLAGYRFSKHLSVETGLGWSLKNYYTKGKYFDKKKTDIPDAVNIYFTNGDCKMFDVPLNVKYDFAFHKQSNLFLTAGLSSYFMKKENYSYTGDYWGWVYDTTRHYNNSGANLLSVVNLSIGYQKEIGKHSSLRIEPYIKLPLHGIGIANLPITSTGISVGFTRKF